MDVNPIEVQKHLKGASYPTDAEDLARTAEGNGAPQEIVERIRSTGGEFSGPDEVMERLAR
jgi:hypothetical protein